MRGGSRRRRVASRRSPGLWDEWKDIETGEPLKSCTMITTEANDFVSEGR
jgi:putative SOS response-associated peptidase YedK